MCPACGLGRASRRRLQLGLDRGFLAQRSGSSPVDRPVDHDPVQPGPERAPAIEAVQRPHRRQEGLLRDVLGRRGIVDHQVRGPVSPRPMAPVELLERLLRAALCRPNPAPLPPPVDGRRTGDRPAPRERDGDALRASVGGQMRLLPGARRNQRRLQCCHLPSNGPAPGHPSNTSCVAPEVPKAD